MIRAFQRVEKRRHLLAAKLRQIIAAGLLAAMFGLNVAQAGVLVTNANGISLTGSDGISLTGSDGISLTGADGVLTYKSNGISLTGADGISLTGADGAISLTGADGAAYTGSNGISLTGADGISLTGADGISLTGADGISLTGADGNTYHADSFHFTNPTGISLTGADGISLTGADGISLTGADGISLTGADGISLTGADGISLTGADGVFGIRTDGSTFALAASPNSAISLTGADGITIVGGNGISLTGADGISLTGADSGYNASLTTGLQSVDPELAILLNQTVDDSTINCTIVFHRLPTENDFNNLRNIGIVGGTKFRKLPFVIVTARRSQIIQVSRLLNVRSIYGVRTLELNSDPYFKNTQIGRVAADRELQQHNQGAAVSGRGVTVAVLDTGINALHNDLAGRVVQNVRLSDGQSAQSGFNYPTPLENLQNTDWAGGHGSFVAGVVAGSGAYSAGRYSGVAPGAKLLGLSAGDLNLTHVLAGFDYLLDKGALYNVRAVNCSFSSNTVFDWNDPVNVATKLLTDNNISVVFSAGNTGSGNSTLNPYAVAPWVISVGATDETGRIAAFSSRGTFGKQNFAPTLVAPGVNIVSLRSLPTETSLIGVAVGNDLNRLTPNELPYYTTASGTSFSAPQVAGAIALMLEANPNLTAKQVKDILQRTATALPPYYRHEVGAGMLNSHAATIEAANPNRRAGIWRALSEQGRVKFVTDPAFLFENTAYLGMTSEDNFQIPANAIHSTVHIAWGNLFTVNDLGLRVQDQAGALRGESNYLNQPGLTGRREKITFVSPQFSVGKILVRHTGGVGTAQKYFGAVETTRAEISISDIANLPLETQNAIKESLRTYQILPIGSRFRPNSPIARIDFAAALIRGGRVPQFVAAGRMFADVPNLTERGIIESVQNNPTGALIFDAANSSSFNPYSSTSRLVAAVALVKAAGFHSLAISQANLPVPVADNSAIPAAWRGYVTVALQKGLLVKDGNNFSPNKPLMRRELATSITTLNRIFTN